MPEMYCSGRSGASWALGAITGACCTAQHPAPGQSCAVLLQGASWSGLDFGGHWRLLHYSLKRIFAPVLVSAYWDGGDSSVHVWVVSDLNHPVTGELHPRLHHFVLLCGARGQLSPCLCGQQLEHT